MAEVENCKEGSDHSKFVYFIKQWHLGPKADTTLRPPTEFPQYMNQQAIYGQLVQWSEKESKGIILMEGCEGELRQKEETRFNGLTLGDLLKMPENELHLALTHLGMKFYAYKTHHPSQLEVTCGDSESLISKHALTYSDLRGFVGFYERLAASKEKSPELYEKYLKGAREVLELGADSKVLVTDALKERILSKLQSFEEFIEARNDAFLKQIEKQAGVVIVILGGVHAPDFKEKLEARGIGCKLLTPVGYPGEDESELVKSLKAKFNHHPERS